MNLSNIFAQSSSFLSQPWLRSAVFLMPVSGILLVALQVLAAKQILPLAGLYGLTWVILVGMFALLTMYPWQRFHRQHDRLFLEALVAGMLVALAPAIVQVILYRELWSVLNLLAEPVRIGLVGVVITWLTVQFARSRPPSVVVA